MNAKTVLLLTLLAGLAALGAWFLAFRPAAPGGPAGGGGGERLVAPGIRDAAGTLARIEIEKTGERVELEKADGGWVVASLGGYPADAGRVRRLVTTLSELRVVEEKTARPEFYSRLAVQWPDAGGDADDPGAARPTLVRLLDAEGEPIAEIVLGSTTFVGTDAVQHARPLGDEQSVLVSSRVEAPAGTMRWINARFIELPRDSVERVTITHPDGETVTVSRGSGDADFAVENVPEGMEPISEGQANRVGNALAFVNFTEVRAKDAAERAPEPVTAVYETFEGLTLTLSVEPIPSAAEGGGSGPAGAWVEASASGEGADAYADRFARWSFRLPASAAESLSRHPSDLLRPVETDEAGPAAPDDGVPELLRPPGDG